MAKIRIVPAVLTGDGHIDPQAWQVQISIGLPVGLCGCGGVADGEPIQPWERAWANCRCGTCGAEACRPLPAAATTAR